MPEAHVVFRPHPLVGRHCDDDGSGCREVTVQGGKRRNVIIEVFQHIEEECDIEVPELCSRGRPERFDDVDLGMLFGDVRGREDTRFDGGHRTVFRQQRQIAARARTDFEESNRWGVTEVRLQQPVDEYAPAAKPPVLLFHGRH